MNTENKIAFLEQFGVDVRTGISNMMDIETYDEIMNDFYESMPEELQKINKYKMQNDMPNYAILVHYVNEHFNEFLSATSEVLKIIEEYKKL